MRERRVRAELAGDPRLRSAPGAAAPTLFDVAETSAPGASAAAPAGDAGTAPAETAAARRTAADVTGSAAYKTVRRISARVAVSDEQIADLLAVLLEAPGGRVTPAQAAAALAVAPAGLRGAILHAQRLLNVEGYPVLRVDADGATVILDELLLREQFGLRSS